MNNVSEKNIAVVNDGMGNEIIVVRKNNILTISLKLSGDNYKRDLGYVDMSNRKFYVKRNREKHLFKKNSSYGFNHKLLNDAKQFDQVVIQDEHSLWEIPREYILKNGSFLHFKSDGFERQIFIQLDKIKQFTKEPNF
jgi:hypothetical protein